MTPRPPTQPTKHAWYPEFRASGRRAESLRSVARFILLTSLLRRRFGNRQRLSRTCLEGVAAVEEPGRQPLTSPRLETSCRRSIVARLLHPRLLGNTKAAGVQPAGDGGQPRDATRHHAVGYPEGGEHQQF